MKNKSIILLAIIAISLISPIAMDSSDASTAVTVNGITLSTFDDNVSIAAGDSATISIMMTNNSTDYISTSVKIDPSKNYSCSVETNEYHIAKGNAAKCTVDIKTTKYSEHGDYSVNIHVNVFNFATNVNEETNIIVKLTIEPEYSDSGGFNKIFGVFDPLPEPFNTPLISASITFVMWCGIACLAYVALRMIWARIFKNDDDDRKDITKTTGRMMILVIIVIGIRKSLIVFGAYDVIINAVEDVTNLILVARGTIIAWSIYKNLISTLFHKSERNGKLTGVDTTLIPLFRMIGKVVISVCSVSAFLSILGMNLMAILTGAGIVGIAISLGAQGILTEFFGGVSILVTRPFKVGDMVQIGTEKNIYEVRRIGLLNCEFKNWTNREHYILPNSAVSTSSIVNITGRTDIYRIYLYFDVDYDAPIERTKEIILKHAYNNSDVVTDQDGFKPSVRLDSFDYSYMSFRLAVYIKNFKDNIRVTGELNESIYSELVEEGIDCPYEIYDVFVKDEAKEN